MAHVVIIGAGPGGLGTGWRLLEQGFSDFVIVEKNPYPGGLSASFQTPAGFIFDLGGHVFFSRDAYFLQVAESLLKPAGEINFRTRQASVYLGHQVIPYPFQDNIPALPPAYQYHIILDLLANMTNKKKNRPAPVNFLNWSRQHFGKTLSDIFMVPYNRKVWAWDLKKMGAYWIQDRVSTLQVQDILKRIIFKEQTHDWGPNAQFFYPAYGCGYLFQRIAERLKDHILYNNKTISIDTHTQHVKLSPGETMAYSHLVSSMPLTEFFRRIEPLPRVSRFNQAREAARQLRYNSGLIVGFGIDFNIGSDKHWVYFPDSPYPWFRMTVLSNYSPLVAPPGKSSLMFDIAYNPYRGTSIQARDIIPLLKTISFLPPIDENHITSVFEKKVAYFYPIPTRERDRHLTLINEFLDSRGIYSIGRFGRWRYEEGNMDHAFLQGKTVAEQILSTI